MVLKSCLKEEQGNLRMILEQWLNKNQNIIVNFIDLVKAFNMGKLGIEWKKYGLIGKTKYLYESFTDINMLKFKYLDAREKQISWKE